MPFFFSDRLPVPTLKSYTVVSVLIFGAALLYAHNTFTESAGGTSFLSILIQESFCLWAIVNIAYCCLFLFGKIIQRFIFGKLRVVEEQHLQDKFWNYIFYKVIFIFGVINAQTLTEVLCWTAWFSMLGFWHMFGQLCKDRYEYLTSSPNTTHRNHIKVLSLLVVILLSSICLSGVAVHVAWEEGWNILGFMLAECVLLGLKCLQIIVKYGIQLMDASGTEIWERKASISYYSDFFLELTILGTNLIHHLHMLIWSNVFLSMASLVLYWNIRSIFSELKKRLRKHKTYKKIIETVKDKFPLATEEDLTEYEDHCAICWENMMSARKLPCGHLFHHACLCSWLQQDTSCPTCRRPLATDMHMPDRQTPHERDDEADIQQFADQGNARNHFFHFDGTRVATWFPSFSIEVFHGNNGDMGDQQLEELVHQVQTMFPNIPYEAILEDLRRTTSAEATIENILEGNILILPGSAAEEAEAQSAIPEERPVATDVETDTISETAVVSEVNNTNDNDSVSSKNAETSEENSDSTASIEFSEEPGRRQRLLSQRRQMLMSEARRRYVSKSKEQTTGPTKDLNQSSDKGACANVGVKYVRTDHDDRRAKMLEAVERRLNRRHSTDKNELQQTQEQTDEGS